MRLAGMKFILVCVFSFLFCQVKAQDTSAHKLHPTDNGLISSQSFADVYLKNPGDNALKITAGAFNYSTAIPFSFTKEIGLGKFIDDELKYDAGRRLKKINYQEFGYDAGISWYHYWSDSSLFRKCVTGVSLSERSVTELRFSKDAFNTVFFGNAMYAGDSAFFTGTGLLNIHFRQLKFNWLRQFGNNDSAWTLSLSASLLQGIDAGYLATGKSSLYTEQNGEYIDLSSAFLYSQSHTSSSSPFAFNGTGLSADLVLSFPMGARSNFIFSVQDAGYIQWNRKSLRYLQDTSIHFEGVEVNNLFSFKDTSFLNINTDSILQLMGVESSEQSFTTRLPMRIGMCYTVTLWQNQAELRAGFEYKTSFDLLPCFFVSLSSFKPKFVYPTVLLSAGGTRVFSAGVGLSKVINDKVFISAGSNDLLGIIAPGTFGSASAFARAGIRF